MKTNKQKKNVKEISITYADDDSININIFDNKVLMEVVGAFDNNLKELERFTGSKIYFRGNSITIKGKKFENERVKGAIEYLIDTLTENEEGVRNLKRCLEIIYTKLNLYRLMKPNTNLFEKDMSLEVEFPFNVTKDIVDKLIKKSEDDGPPQGMYM